MVFVFLQAQNQINKLYTSYKQHINFLVIFIVFEK